MLLENGGRDDVCSIPCFEHLYYASYQRVSVDPLLKSHCVLLIFFYHEDRVLGIAVRAGRWMFCSE
jgi:hypothetical protein